MIVNLIMIAFCFHQKHFIDFNVIDFSLSKKVKIYRNLETKFAARTARTIRYTTEKGNSNSN